MVVFVRAANPKGDIHKGMKTFETSAAKIAAGSEAQTIKAELRCILIGQQRGDAAILICAARGNNPPLAALVPVKSHSNMCGRTPAGEVEDMSRDTVHDCSHFLSRICVICLCCSAVSRNSV